MILILLFVSFAAEGSRAAWMLEPLPAFGAGLLLYLGLLSLIVLQNRVFGRMRKERLLTIVNLECLLFFGVFHYLLGAHRLFTHDSFQFGAIFFALLLYLTAIAVFHASRIEGNAGVGKQIRLLIPFAMPFLLFILATDLLQLLPFDWDTWSALIPSLLFLGLLLLFLPIFLIWIWKCEPMEESDLKRRLEALCEKAHFRYSGLKTWGVLDSLMTAAIVGIAPAFRYILFTKKLLKSLSPEAVEAVLAHEIGHSKRRHLLWYPLIFLGMTVLLLLISSFFLMPFQEKFFQIFGESWMPLMPLALFIPFGLVFLLYFRFVYGYFSRLFERQADLYVFDLGVAPEAMIEALDHVGAGIHLVPNWHHYSIQERIDFLKKAMRDPQAVPQHHARVRRALIFYMILLLLGFILLTFY